MNNILRQKWCDEQKWLTSEAKGCDQSGAMSWCDGCENKGENRCNLLHEERNRTKACATAYNRHERKRRYKKLNLKKLEELGKIEVRENGEYFYSYINIYCSFCAKKMDNIDYFIAKNGSRVVAEKGSWVYAEKGSTVHANEGSCVSAKSGSKVFAENGSWVSAENRSCVSAKSGSKVYAKRGSTVFAYEESTVYAENGSWVFAHEGSTVFAYEESTVYAEKGSTVIRSEVQKNEE